MGGYIRTFVHSYAVWEQDEVKVREYESTNVRGDEGTSKMRNAECGMGNEEGRGEGPGSLSGLLPPTAYLLPPVANIRRLPFQAITLYLFCPLTSVL